jgi:pimeloyl-ACP methyl ester carboxylesterase
LLKKFLAIAGVDGYYELMLPLLLSAEFLSADFERTKSILAHMRANSASPEGLAAQIEANLTYDLSADAGSVRVPVLVTVGQNDVLLPPSAAKEIVDTIPNAEFVVFPGGPHLVTMETPAVFNETTLEWMRRNCR